MDGFKFLRLATSWSVVISLLISLVGGPPPVARAGALSDITVTVSDKAVSSTAATYTFSFKIETKLPKDSGRVNIQMYGPAGDFNYNFNDAQINTAGTSPNSFEVYRRDWQGIVLKSTAEVAASTTVTIKLDKVKNPAKGGYYFFKLNTQDNYTDLDGSNNFGGNYHTAYIELGTNTNVKGKITDGKDNAVPFTYVTLNKSSGSSYTYYNTYTDKNGDYGFGSIEEGTWNFGISPPPTYGTGKTYISPAQTTVSVPASGSVAKDSNFKATTKTIKGKISRPNGTAVTDASVSASSYSTGSGGYGGYVSANSDASGNYSFEVSGGTWSVSIYPKNYPADWQYNQGSINVTFADDSTTETATRDFSVIVLNSTVKGKVERDDGSTLPTYWGSLNFTCNNIYSGANSKSDGTFEAKVAAGTCTVSSYSSENEWSFPAVASFSIGENETKDLGTLKLKKKTDTITGTVKDDEGNPVQNAYVSAWRNATNYQYGSATSDSEGKYTIKVDPGKDWQVSAYPNWNSGYLNNSQPQTVEVKAGIATIVNFTFRKSTATFDCRLTDPDGNPLTGVSAWAQASDNSQAWANTGTSVTDGTCNPGLKVPPGTWDVSISLYHQDYSSPDPQKISISKDETKTVTFKALKNDAELSGTIYDEDGNKVTGKWMNVWATKGKYGSWQSGNFDQNTGTYSMKLAAGTWNFGYWISGDSGYNSGGGNDVEITLAAKEKKTYDIRLKKANATINGTAKKSNGDAIQWAWITADSRDPNEKKSADTYYYSNGASSDQNGKFNFNLPPGTYFVGASYTYSSGGLVNPQREKVEIKADETKTVDLVFREADGVITGTVKLDGNPTNAYVTAYSEKGGYAEGNASNEGKFELKVAKGDKWHVRAILQAGKEIYKAKEVIVDLTDTANGTADLSLTKQTYTLPTTTTVTFDPTKQQTVTVDDGTVVSLPANSISTSGTSTLTVTPDANLPAEDDAKPLAYGYDMNVVTDGSVVTTFKSEVTIELKYKGEWLTENNITNENDVRVAFYDKTAGTWRELENCSTNEGENTVTCRTDHFTKFAAVAASDTTPPAAPGNPSATAGDASAALEWKNPSDGDFASVTIYRSEASGTLGDKIKTGETGTSYADSGLTNGTTYFYTVRAVDKSGNESTNVTQVSAQPKSGLAKAVAKGKVLPKTGSSLEATRPSAWPIVALISGFVLLGGTLLLGLRRRR